MKTLLSVSGFGCKIGIFHSVILAQTKPAKAFRMASAIASLLRHRRNVTFFTQDNDFYKSRFCHLNCCIVLLNVLEEQAAEYIRKFLRHSAFQTQAQRMGTVVRVSHDDIHLWRLHAEAEEPLSW